MGRRQLPLLGAAPAAASPSPLAEPQVLAVDRRCFAIVCRLGLDAAADWVARFLQGFAHAGVELPLVYVAHTLPVSAAGRAVVDSAVSVSLPGVAFAQPAAPLWLLVTDDQSVPHGARTLLVLVDRLPARTLDVYGHAAAFLPADRPAAAGLLARSVAASARPTV